MSRVRHDTHETIASRASRGDYALVEPLDTIILKALPNEGTLFADLYPLGETAANIAKNKLGGKLSSGTVASRLGALHKMGLAIPQVALGTSTKGAVWQRTKAAVELIASKEGQNGSSNKD